MEYPNSSSPVTNPPPSLAQESGIANPSNVICLKPRPTSNLPKIDQASALIANERVAPPTEIVGGLIHAGTKCVLASGSKIGKTWILLYLAACVVAGIPFLGFRTSPGKVLVINLEILRAFIKKRLESIKERLQLDNLDNLHVWSLRGQSDDAEALLEEIIQRAKLERYVLIIIDPIYKLMVGRSENMAGGVGALCHYLEHLAEETGAAIVYAHHYTKGNAAKKKSIDRMSGSGVFARDADTIITLTEHKVEGCYVFETTLRNLPPQAPFVVEWAFPIMVERTDLDPADLNSPGNQEADDLEPLLQLLDEKPLPTGEWQKLAENDGYSRATFFRMKQKLESAGLLAFDRREKTWARAGEQTSTGTAEADSTETSDTIDTAEANRTEQQTGESVSSLTDLTQPTDLIREPKDSPGDSSHVTENPTRGNL